MNREQLLIRGMALLIIGMSMNHIVMMGNGGMMPVYKAYPDWAEKPNDEVHFLYEDKTKIPYWQFSDIFNIRYFAFSLGDAFMISGSLLILTAGGLVIKGAISDRRNTSKEKKKRNKGFPYKRKREEDGITRGD